MEVAIVNGSDSALTVESASIESTALSAAASTEHGTTIDAGDTTNLRVQLPETACGSSSVETSVRLRFSLADGRSGEASTTPDDPFDAIARVVAQDCAAQSVARIVTISPADTLRVVDRAGTLTAELDLTFEPTGEAGEVTIESVSDTILVRSVSKNGWPVNTSLTASSKPLTVTLDFLPNNCRLHTVAEDKRGTFFPIIGRMDGEDFAFSVPSTTSVKKQIYEYIARYCDWK